MTTPTTTKTPTTRPARNVYTLDQVRLAKVLLQDAPYETRVASGEMKRISRETGIKVPMLHAIANGRAHAGVETAPATKGD